jgi:hypothetical protein
MLIEQIAAADSSSVCAQKIFYLIVRQRQIPRSCLSVRQARAMNTICARPCPSMLRALPRRNTRSCGTSTCAAAFDGQTLKRHLGHSCRLWPGDAQLRHAAANLLHCRGARITTAICLKTRQTIALSRRFIFIPSQSRVFESNLCCNGASRPAGRLVFRPQRGYWSMLTIIPSLVIAHPLRVLDKGSNSIDTGIAD